MTIIDHYMIMTENNFVITEVLEVIPSDDQCTRHSTDYKHYPEVLLTTPAVQAPFNPKVLLYNPVIFSFPAILSKFTSRCHII